MEEPQAGRVRDPHIYEGLVTFGVAPERIPPWFKRPEMREAFYPSGNPPGQGDPRYPQGGYPQGGYLQRGTEGGTGYLQGGTGGDQPYLPLGG